MYTTVNMHIHADDGIHALAADLMVHDKTCSVTVGVVTIFASLEQLDYLAHTLRQAVDEERLARKEMTS